MLDVDGDGLISFAEFSGKLKTFATAKYVCGELEGRVVTGE